MHPVLQTPELLEQIFDLVPRSSLPSLARTRGVFFHPTACRLWARCDTLVDLARCLPESCWEGVDYTPGGVRMKITRQITVADAQRVRIYAAFITYANLHELEVAVAPSDIAQLAGVMDGGYLLPNLRRLSYYATYQCPLSAILPLLLPPGLSVFMTGLWRSDPPSTMGLAGAAAEISAMSMLKARGTASITSLTIGVDFGDVRVLIPWAELLAGWDSLQFLDIAGDVDYAALRSIANLPCLHTLALRSRHQPLPLLVPPRWRSSSTMRSLTIFGSLAVSAVAYIHSFQQAPIENLSIMFVQDRSENPIQTICRAVGQCCAVQSLTSFRLTPPYYSRVAEDGPANEFTDIEPLLAFRRLTSLRIKSYRALSLRDEDMLRIARMLPDLDTLELWGNAWRPPKCTMLSLLHLARYCPHLWDLTLAVDATEIRIPEAVPIDIVQHSLKVFRVHRSPIGSEVAVASFLSILFPRLRSIITEEPAGLDGDRQELRRCRSWLHVREALAHLAVGFNLNGAADP
ncbi:hypothetical protein K525DRAFT_209768 [Schizophyllum commune Loenen D]|nr:hypothetical protein K525DRAFT_209768 [Schizophyllum commune Loenen D]